MTGQDGPPTLLHLGYPKASSTWLQDRLFKFPEMGFWPIFPEKADRARLNRLLVYPEGYGSFDPALAEEYADRLAARPRADLVPVISAESLVGTEIDPNRAVGRLIAERLKELVPEARVLIIIREQVSMIRSRYLYYVRGGGTLPLKRFIERPEMFETRAWTGCYLDYFKYDSLVAYYQSLYGASQVLALPLELLRRDPQAYVEAIRSFSGVRGDAPAPDFGVVKGAIPTGSVPVRRFLGKICSREELNPLSRLMPEPVYWRLYAPTMRGYDRLMRKMSIDNPKKLSERIARLVGDHFVESNRRTAALTGTDLGRYGYRL